MQILKNVEVKILTKKKILLLIKIIFSFLEFEQDIVEWIDESKVSLCPSCAKPFGLSRRKHHCRLDGFVICNQCSQFLPFSIARKISMDMSASNTKEFVYSQADKNF